MTRRKSRSEAAIENQLNTLDPSSCRYAVLSATRDFKAAWVRLGTELTAARESGDWKDWGYPSFEAYCRRELHLRRDTANKLTRSYAFLRDHEPSALEDMQERELPELDVVDLLSRAQERTTLSSGQIDQIRSDVFDPETQSPSRSQVVKRFRELDPEAFRQQKAPVSPPVSGKAAPQDIRKASLLADRLRELLQNMPQVSTQSREAAGVICREMNDLAQQTAQAAAS